MNNIEVAVIAEHGMATEMMAFLARLTQRGSDINSMDDLKELLAKPASDKLIKAMMGMEHHGTIKRFSPITIAIVGASRRFLAQARTNQVGFTYVSASLQYSDYSGKANFVVPYALLGEDKKYARIDYLATCEAAMNAYSRIAKETDNDTAGYAAPQGLRNILIMQGNNESWAHFLKTRMCNRNTVETQYVAYRIWEALLNTDGGELFFDSSVVSADCVHGVCKEGKMCCGTKIKATNPTDFIKETWPLLEV